MGAGKDQYVVARGAAGAGRLVHGDDRARVGPRRGSLATVEGAFRATWPDGRAVSTRRRTERDMP